MNKQLDLLLKQLKQQFSDLTILTTKETMRPFESDALAVYQSIPLAVFLPSTKTQVIAIVKACYQHDMPLVSRGAGTGISGGALPYENGVLLSLSKLTQILDVNPERLTATVQPGVRNISISQAVEQHGLFYAPDPSSQIACTIGGNVAENSGGVHCLKYGLTVHNLQAIEMVTSKGDLLTFGGDTLDSQGHELLALMTGSEGLFGIFTEITVKLKPKPPFVKVMLAAFNSIADGSNTVSDIIGSGVIPAGLEMMDKLSIDAIESYMQAGYPLDAEAILICELDGTEEDIAKQLEIVDPLLKKNHCIELKIAENEEQASKIWAGRKAAFPAVGRIAPDYYCMDGTIPKSELAFVLDEIYALAKKYDLGVANVFHAGDGNLHPLILFDASIEGEQHKAEAFGAEILELSIKVGGTITGEHGVGIEKIDQMCSQFSKQELAQFHRVKQAFDDKTLLNPNKTIPELHRCAELGAMHVHNGELPFPELERF